MTKSCCAPSVADGSQAVLAALLEKRGEFLAFAERQVRDAALAEELVQASFAKAAERIHQLESPDSARPWFYRMLRNAALDHRRRRSAEQRAMTALAAEQGDAALARERSPRVCQCVSRAMASLKPEYEAALRGIEIDGASVKEFAFQQGIAANNAAVRAFRAREALKRKVESTCGSCADGGGCFDCNCEPA